MSKYEYQRPTDQVHKIKLTSAISHATWDRPVASTGEKVEALVYTHFVGNGSEIRISIHNKSGKRLDRIEGEVYGNRFKSIWTVSDKAQDAVYFEAELKKHGLKEKSEEMEIIPPIEITNAKWSQQEARRGDILKLTADVTGAPDGTEALIEIHEHDDNGAHDFVTKLTTLVDKNKIEAEWEFEYQGDIGDIPTEEESEAGYSPPRFFFRVSIYGASAESGLLEFIDWVAIELMGEDGEYMADVDYVIYLPDGQKRQGKLDKDGYAKESDVAPGRFRVEFADVEGNITYSNDNG